MSIFETLKSGLSNLKNKEGNFSISNTIKDNISNTVKSVGPKVANAVTDLVTPIGTRSVFEKVSGYLNKQPEIVKAKNEVTGFIKEKAPVQYQRATEVVDAVKGNPIPLFQGLAKQLKEPTPITRAMDIQRRDIAKDPTVTEEERKMAFDALATPVMGITDGGGEGLLNVAKKELNPVIKQGAFNAQDYIAENIAKREAARISDKPTVGQKIISGIKNLKQKIVESNSPVEDILNNYIKENKIDLLPSKNISNNIDRVYRSRTLAGQFVKDNGLFDVIRNVDNIDAFDEYLIAKQAIDVNTRGFKTGRDVAKDEALVTALRDQYEPQAQIIRDYGHKLLDNAVDSGLLSKRDSDYLKEIYPNYVPINRVFNELEKADNMFNSGGGIANVSKQNVVKKLQGSERAIESPTYSLIKKTYENITQSEKNKAFNVFTDYKDLPGNPFNIKQVRKTDPGFSETGTITGFKDGKKVFYQVPKDIEKVLKNLSPENLGLAGKIMAWPVRVFKLGTTGLNPAFILKNLTRDQFTAAINSDKAFKTSIANPKVWFKGFTSAIKKDELYDDFIRQAGGGTSFDVLRDTTDLTTKSIRSTRSKGSRIKYLVTHPGDLQSVMEDLVSVTENATRLQQYKGTLDDLVANGMPLKEAKIQAAKAARDNTANFARHGEYGKIINSVIPYLNAGIQGSRASIKAAIKNPVAFTAKVASLVMLPETTLTLWNMSDDKRREAYMDIPEYEKEANFIFIPNNPTQDKDGKWNIIKIPKPPGISNLTTLVRRPLEDYHGGNPVKFKEMADAVVGSVSPVEPNKKSILSTITPQYVRPSIESANNRNMFTGFPIVPKSMEGLSPELQVKDNTTASAKAIAKLTGGSPIKTEAWIKSTFGQAGFNMLNVTDRAAAGLNIIDRKDVGGQSYGKAVVSAFTKAGSGESEGVKNDVIYNLLQKQTDERFVRKIEAEALWEELKGLPKPQRDEQYFKIKQENPELAAKLKETSQQEKLGLTRSDRLIMQLGVANQARATYVYENWKVLKTPEEKKAYIEDLKKKKIITEEVALQLKKLKANDSK
tara:strand:+ start:2633 stop:5806 length:3174 start_codon:yes stop_codon:yes gene_type:complete